MNNTANDEGEKEEDEDLGVRTETMRPSFGMKAGLLLSRSLVCRVLKLISS